MQLIDTHGHLNFGAFAGSWADVADRSFVQGVKAIIMPGSQLGTSRRSIELARERPGKLFAAVGLHPTHVAPRDYGLRIADYGLETDKFEEFDYQDYLDLARQPAVVAIGEVGLDTYRVRNQKSDLKNQNDNEEFKIEEWLEEQECVLHEFIQIAQAVKKPLIVHCRGAKKPTGDQRSEIRDQNNPHERLIGILSDLPENERPQFVVHCYQGTVDQAARYLELGGLISFTGTITYSDDPAVVDVVRSIPLGKIMIETDSPYLSPVPYRGEPNEPWKVVEVARRIADLHEQTLDEVADQTTATAQAFFGFVGAR